MSSPKPTKHLMSSPPVSSSARFRSPGIVRRNIIGDPGFQSAQFAKKSRRSKSSETNSRDTSSNILAGKRKLSKPNENAVEDHLETLNYRWRLMAKNQEKMTKEEIMTNYKLLLTDHIKLEKFMSLISRENELNRTRLESDLLDSMMLVEDLKQSLQATNMNRRSRSDPRDSEERRELIKQNKKLVSELHESSKKNDKLELLIFDLKDQVELADFQMMEVQNQKIMMEEQMDVRGPRNSVSCQTIEASFEEKLATLTEERDSVRRELETVMCDYNQFVYDMKTLQDDNEVLKISEENLQEELVIKMNEIKSLMKNMGMLEDRIKNSMDDAPPSAAHVHVNGPRSVDDETTICCSDDFDDSSIATDSGFELTDKSVNAMSGDLLADTVRMLWAITKDKDDEIVRLKKEIKGLDETPTCYKSLQDELEDATKFSTNPYGHHQSTNDKQTVVEKSGRQSPLGACCSSLYKLKLLEKENRRWKSFVENIGKAENELLQVIADLEEAVRTHKQDSSGRMDDKFGMSPQKFMNGSCKDRSAEYFNRRLEEIKLDHNEDQVGALISEAERVRDDAKRQMLRLGQELDGSNQYIEKLDSELTTTKKIELTLRRRIEVLEQRVIDTQLCGSLGPTKTVVELETKMAQLETVNASLIEVNMLEKRRMEEQRQRIYELELTNKSMQEKLNVVHTRESFAQKKINRLQGVYEDLLREYATLRAPSSDRQRDTCSVNEENKRQRIQIKELKEKCEELQSLVIRYQRHLFVDGKQANKFLNSHLRDFETKMTELTKMTK